MNLKYFFSKQTINSISRIHGRVIAPYSCCHRSVCTVPSIVSPCSHSSSKPTSFVYHAPNGLEPFSSFNRFIHSGVGMRLNELFSVAEDDSKDDGTMNDFLSRFVWIMRGKLSEVYIDADKKTIDGMLLIIVGKVVSELEKGSLEQLLDAAAPSTSSQDFSEDLWRTVWEVSNAVLEDMEKARKKEKMKSFLQSEEVKKMYRFAGEVGIRGDMLRELRFKWAREKMEEREFYESLERLRREDAQAEEREEERITSEQPETTSAGAAASDFVVTEEKNIVTLPKRHGKMKYKIYGLDLSDPKWAEVANRIHDVEEILWPQEAKPISGKCKLVTEKILQLKEDDDPSSLLAEWVELLKPGRVDWIALLEQLNARNRRLYLKIAELLLQEESFQTNMHDYTKLIDTHAKENRLEDAERILKKMNENGVLPDIMTSSIMVHMYSKAGNLERAKEAFERLRNQGFQPDMRVYESIIMAYVNVGQPKLGESLLREMDARDIKPTEEIYMALLRSFAQSGDVNGAQRISTAMHFAGFQPSLESCTLLVEAYGQASDPDQARNHFDHIFKVGFKPDDRCTACMISAYEKKNLLDKALDLLLHLEKDGFEPGVATYSVLVDWLGKLLLIDEAEQLSGKIVELGEAPPLKVHISLCDMYARARNEKKTLQALGVLESKKDQLGQEEYERIVNALGSGGFVEDARRMQELMEAQGFTASEPLKVGVMVAQAFTPAKDRRFNSFSKNF